MHHTLDEIAFQRGADVQVGQLCDAEAFEIRRKPRDRYVHYPHQRGPPRAPQTHHQHGDRTAHDHQPETGDAQPGPHMQRVSRQHEHDQQRRQSHGRETGDLEAALRRQPLGPSGDERHERGEDEEQDAQPTEQAPPERERRGGEQALPHIQVQQRPHGGHHDDAREHPPAPGRGLVRRLGLHDGGNVARAREVAAARSVVNALADREAPAAAGEPLAKAVTDGKLRHIAAHGAGRPDA